MTHAPASARLVALHRRVAGREAAPLLSLLRALLVLPALAYAAVARLRNALYDAGILRALRSGAPTISVGNLTTGGTGKTPLVLSLASAALRGGLRPAILLRGYRRGDSARSDEAALLERLLPGVPVVTGPDRVKSAAIATAHGANLLILDDGFQHRRLARDCDIVLLDAREPFGGDWQLPRGHLREPVSGLRRARLVVLTRVDRAGGSSALGESATIARIREHTGPHVPILFESHRPTWIVGRDGAPHRPAAALAGKRVAAFSGVGDPGTLGEMLRALGADVVANHVFADHHEYSVAEIESIAAAARAGGAESIVTTEKDLVRIDSLAPHVELLALRIDAAVETPADPGAVRTALGFEWPLQN
jgi:tetraacyldisaccharide 4'-kinase